jgi:DNA-binding PadR family transcriptional regulator
MTPDDTQIYRAVRELQAEALIDFVREEPGRIEGKIREIYAISGHGNIRLQEEITRLEQAVKIARYAGVTASDEPTDIQRLRLDLLDRGEA